MSSPDNLDFHLEISLTWNGIPQMSRTTTVSKQSLFSDILKNAIQELILDSHPNLSEWEIFTGRPVNTPFFPIAANEFQKKAWEEKQKTTKRIVIPSTDLILTYAEIHQKYQITDYFLMKKPA